MKSETLQLIEKHLLLLSRTEVRLLIEKLQQTSSGMDSRAAMADADDALCICNVK